MFNGFGFSIRNWKTAVNFSVETETPLLKPKNRLDFVLIYRRMIVINIERTKTAVDTETADKPRQLLTNRKTKTDPLKRDLGLFVFYQSHMVPHQTDLS